MIGDSTISASGKTMPKAARLISGSASRATMAFAAGDSTVISSQLAANGHQVCMIRRMGNGAETLSLVGR